jgi:hypothetical protein
MSDPITVGLASTALGLVNSTIGLLKEAKAAAKRSDDHDLKDKLSEVFDAVLDLKEVVGNLREENEELRKRLETRTNVKWDSKLKLYFASGDPDPFCPSCMDLNAKQARLQPLYSNGEFWKYQCKICKNEFYGGK